MGGDFPDARRYDSATASHGVKRGAAFGAVGTGVIREHNMSTTGWVVIGVVVVIVAWLISVYNGLVAMGQRVSQAFADIDVQLGQRHDLIPNLVETVKGYAAHERGTLEAVIQARNAAVAVSGQGDKVAAENMLSGALGKLFALAEAYPDLKANANFQQLQVEL